MLMDAPETKKGAEAPFLCVPWISIDVHGTKSLERETGTRKSNYSLDLPGSFLILKRVMGPFLYPSEKMIHHFENAVSTGAAKGY